MSRSWSRRSLLRRGALVAPVGLAGCVGRFTGPSPEAQLRERADRLERFTDVRTALEEGYRTVGRYVRTGEGDLGIPFVDPRVTDLDPERPGAVLYGLTDDGTYEALGLKWFVAAEGRDSAPSLFGRTFDGPLAGEAPSIPRHYGLHAWLFRENPDGLFATYNSGLDPSDLVERIAPVRETLADYWIGADAREAGYTNTEECVATADGGYGVPFVRDDDGAGGTDPETPPVLLYRVTSNWAYLLMGAEWYVPTADADGPPSLFGERFHDAAAGHSPKTDQPDHYGLHAWLFHANPDGLFAPFNPVVSC